MPRKRSGVGRIPVRSTALAGNAVVMRNRAGVTIGRAWPKPRKTFTAKQRNAMAAFKEAAIAIKQMDSNQIAQSYALSAGTQLLPRDLLMQSLYGRTGYYVLNDGRRIYSMAARQDISEFLDGLGHDKGSVMARDGLFWTPIPPGSPGQVLMMDGPSGLPKWSSAGGLGGARITTLYKNAADSANTTWPKIVSWTSAPIDDLNAWDSNNPAYYFIPPDITAFRILGNIHVTNMSESHGLLVEAINQAGAIIAPGARALQPASNQAYSGEWVPLVGSWTNVGSVTSLRIRVSCSGSPSAAVDAASSISIEWR